MRLSLDSARLDCRTGRVSTPAAVCDQHAGEICLAGSWQAASVRAPVAVCAELACISFPVAEMGVGEKRGGNWCVQMEGVHN